MSFDEYMAAENEVIEFETIPWRYVDEIDSQLYRKYGLFRLNDDNSDFLDISRSMLVAMSEYELPEELQERFKLFFERSIESVCELYLVIWYQQQIEINMASVIIASV